MPFWWRRRRRFWRPYNQYQKRRRRRHYRRKPRYRRRTRKAVFRRRRRRRRRKVRRKRPTIPVRQWQPDSIVKCKIKGIGTLILGSQGRQLVCYTNVKKTLTPPKAPCGGGFACEQYSLGYLYEEFKFGNNIWTKSNIGKDLCRYLLAKFTFYRHPDTDFIISYDRQPPFNTDNLVYQSCHPKLLLLSRHKKLILSKFTKPNGKLTKKFIVKPPKQMLTKWFFTEQFSKFPLLLFRAAACNLNYPNIGCCFQNQILTFSYLNTTFYKQGNWAYHGGDTQPYRPYLHTASKLYTWKLPYTGSTPATTLTETQMKQYGVQIYTVPTTYPASIDYTTGWFCKQILSAVALSTEANWQSHLAVVPTNTCRYNPNTDNGKGNLIYLKSTLTLSWDPPKSDTVLIVKDMPLWLGLYGWLSYVILTKKVQDFFDSYVVVLKSSSLYLSSQPLENELVIPLDTEFTQGKWPFDEPITHNEHNHWWPNVYHQLSILNYIVMCGPYVPKIDLSQTKNNTWELHYNYQFLFKWGGPETPDQPITDPQQQPTYPVPDTLYSTIQIRDPEKQKFETIIHPWDYRRGIVKSSALKRMSSNLSIDSTFEPDGIPHKKKKRTGPELSVPQEEEQEVLSCLHSLCEENIFQETQEENLLQLIQQQQQQQQDLKWNLLRIISELKEKQRELQLQTGLLH
nr:MAG: ORF1 [Torque teno midi virus]